LKEEERSKGEWGTKILFLLFFFFPSFFSSSSSSCPYRSPSQSFRINNKGEETSSDSAFLSLSFLSAFLRYLRGWLLAGVCVILP